MKDVHACKHIPQIYSPSSKPPRPLPLQRLAKCSPSLKALPRRSQLESSTRKQLTIKCQIYRHKESIATAHSSSSKIWKVLFKIVSTTLACHPASAISAPPPPKCPFAPLCWPISVGANTIARLLLVILFLSLCCATRCRWSANSRNVA